MLQIIYFFNQKLNREGAKEFGKVLFLKRTGRALKVSQSFVKINLFFFITNKKWFYFV